MKSDVRRVVVNFTYLAITKGIDFVIPLLLLPYLVSNLGIDSFGQLSFVLAIGIYFTAFMQYGFNITAVREIARVRQDPKALAQVFSNFVAATFLLILIGSLLFLTLLLVDSVYSLWPLYLSTLVFVISQAIMPSWFFQGIEQMKYIAITNSAVKVTYVIAIFMLVKEPQQAYLVPLLQGVAGLVGLVIAVEVIWRNKMVSLVKPESHGIKLTFLEGWPAFVTQIAPTLYTNSTTFILGIFASPAAVGIYSAAARLIDIFNAVAFLMANACLPYLSRDISQHRWVKWVLIVAGLMLSALCYFGAYVFVPLLFNEHQSEITALVQLISPMIFFIFVRFAFGPAYLMLVGKDKAYQNIVLGCALVAFALAWFTIPQWGNQAAALIMVSASALMALFTFGVAQRVRRQDQFNKAIS